MARRSGSGRRGIKAICPSPDDRWRYPLRRVVAEGPIETLECGHTVVRKSDLIGDTFCASRRCPDCWRAMPESERAAKVEAYRARKEQAERRERQAMAEWVKTQNQGGSS